MSKLKFLSAPLRGAGALLRWMVVSVLVVAAAAVAVSAEAQERSHGMRGGEGGPGMTMFGGPPAHMARRIDHMLDGLNASDAQRLGVRDGFRVELEINGKARTAMVRVHETAVLPTLPALEGEMAGILSHVSIAVMAGGDD